MYSLSLLWHTLYLKGKIFSSKNIFYYSWQTLFPVHNEFKWEKEYYDDKKKMRRKISWILTFSITFLKSFISKNMFALWQWFWDSRKKHTIEKDFANTQWFFSLLFLQDFFLTGLYDITSKARRASFLLNNLIIILNSIEVFIYSLLKLNLNKERRLKTIFKDTDCKF